MKIINGINVMIDLETYDTATTAVILSIGAVKFNDNRIIDEFYINVDPKSCLEIGLTQNNDTIEWWNKQGKEAKDILEKDQVSIQEALTKFNFWYGSVSLPTWGNGANFDNPIMETAYKYSRINCPWKFWHDRCFRTIKSIFPIQMDFTGIKHYALDDAIYQAKMLIEIDKILR